MSWAHLDDSRPKARKRHQCLLCEEAIEIGETHVKRSGVNEDGLTSFRMHTLCESLSSRWDHWEWESLDAASFRDEIAELRALRATNP